MFRIWLLGLATCWVIARVIVCIQVVNWGSLKGLAGGGGLPPWPPPWLPFPLFISGLGLLRLRYPKSRSISMSRSSSSGSTGARLDELGGLIWPKLRSDGGAEGCLSGVGGWLLCSDC